MFRSATRLLATRCRSACAAIAPIPIESAILVYFVWHSRRCNKERMNKQSLCSGDSTSSHWSMALKCQPFSKQNASPRQGCGVESNSWRLTNNWNFNGNSLFYFLKMHLWTTFDRVSREKIHSNKIWNDSTVNGSFWHRIICVCVFLRRGRR